MAPSKEERIASSLQQNILNPDDNKPGFMDRFNTSSLHFDRIGPDRFEALRESFKITSDAYKESFSHDLQSMGDMGFSGSTFFTTSDSKYLVKSIPRHFEHSFFRDEMIDPYITHMLKEQNSLLVRITDFLQYAQSSIGSALGTAPSHHIVMENILYGKDRGEEVGEWEDWDLKPMSYFYPERDIANGALTSDETKEKLADEFDDKLVLSLDDAEAFKAQLEMDTRMLAEVHAVDYSLFLVRIPLTTTSTETNEHAHQCDKPPESQHQPDGLAPPSEAPFTPPSPPSWRTGIPSADGKYAYRAAILDFFWSKDKVFAKAMTGLIKGYNLLDRQGPMSVTAEPEEYRSRFLKMCQDMVEVREGR